MEPPLVKDWSEVLLSAVSSAFVTAAGMFAWFGKKLGRYDLRISKLENAHSAQVQQHEANLREMERHQDELVNLDNKLDTQTNTLLKAISDVTQALARRR